MFVMTAAVKCEGIMESRVFTRLARVGIDFLNTSALDISQGRN